MAPIVEAFRLLLLGVGTVEPLHVACSIVTTVAVTVAGLMLFSRIEKTFVDIV
jgi:lipopolysaccharide transport system permease protein